MSASLIGYSSQVSLVLSVPRSRFSSQSAHTKSPLHACLGIGVWSASLLVGLAELSVAIRHSRHYRRHPQTPRPGQDEPLV